MACSSFSAAAFFLRLVPQILTSAPAAATALAKPSIDFPVTGQAITSSLGSATAFTDITVKPTAQSITGTAGVLGIKAYSDVDTGSTTSYTDVNIHQAA